MLGRRFSRTSLALACGLLWWPLAAAAQQERAEREVDVLGTPGGGPVAAYGAADVPLTLVFDSPLQVPDGGLLALAPGVDSRAHPFKNNALIVTPSGNTADGGTIHLRVPLEGWVAEIDLDLTKDKSDQVLKILRHRQKPDGGIEVTTTELASVLRFMAGAALREWQCGTFDPAKTLQPEMIDQVRHQRRVLVCVLESFTVVQVKREHPACPVAWARVLRGAGGADVLYLGGAETISGYASQTLVLRTPPEAADDYQLEMLAADGTVCERYPRLKLQPGGRL